MLVLFFDTYISQGVGDKGGSYQSGTTAGSLASIRDVYPTYRWKRKIDVVKYALSSYAPIKWDKVVIRFECEDADETKGFSEFCINLFPNAKINFERSATASQYFNALSNIDLPDNAWIFFSPNNDHPYLADPNELPRYISILDEISSCYPNNDVGLLYSHYSESILDNRMGDPQWGYFGFKFKKVIYEDGDVYVVKSNIAPLDSIQIFRLSYLKQIFSSTKNTGRVIRLEDTEYCSSPDHRYIQVIPKIELCRHYDGYTHLMNSVPPLFIPDGFFEGEIKIRYGHESGLVGWVNINPLAIYITNDVDIPIVQEDIPYFWRDRVSVLDVRADFPLDLKKGNLEYYKNFNNPWRDRPVFQNYLRSVYIYIVLQGKHKLRLQIRGILISLGIFYYLKSLKQRYLN